MKAEFRHVSFSYRSSQEPSDVLKDLSFTIQPGEFVCLLGPSGGGKSTLLRLLAGLARPDAGQVLIDDIPVSGPSLDRSIVFQEYLLFPWMNALKNVAFCAKQANPTMSRKSVELSARTHLAAVGLGDYLHTYPSQLSGGQRQRVAIAQALAMCARFLIFDEPFGAVDPKTRRMLQQLLEQVSQDVSPRKTVLFVTHDIHEALLLADRILFLDRGQIRGQLQVDLPRPRESEALISPHGLKMQSECLQFYSQCIISDKGV